MCHDSVCDGCLDLTNNRDVAPARLINISLFLGTIIIIVKMLILMIVMMITFFGGRGGSQLDGRTDGRAVQCRNNLFYIRKSMILKLMTSMKLQKVMMMKRK